MLYGEDYRLKRQALLREPYVHEYQCVHRSQYLLVEAVNAAVSSRAIQPIRLLILCLCVEIQNFAL